MVEMLDKKSLSQKFTFGQLDLNVISLLDLQ